MGRNTVKWEKGWKMKGVVENILRVLHRSCSITQKGQKLPSIVVQTLPEYRKHRLQVSCWPFFASSVFKQKEHVWRHVHWRGSRRSSVTSQWVSKNCHRYRNYAGSVKLMCTLRKSCFSNMKYFVLNMFKQCCKISFLSISREKGWALFLKETSERFKSEMVHITFFLLRLKKTCILKEQIDLQCT